MAGTTSLEAVKRKIKFLQEQADGAEERSERLQKELLAEKTAREQVGIFFFFFTARPARQTGAAYQIKIAHLFTHLPLVASLCALCPPFVRRLELETAGFLLRDRKLSFTRTHAVAPRSTPLRFDIPLLLA